GSAIGFVEPTPILSWLTKHTDRFDRFYQSTLLQVPAGLNVSTLVAATDAVLNHHDVLRSRVSYHSRDAASGKWLLEIPPVTTVPASEVVHRVELVDRSPDRLREVIDAETESAAGRLAPALGVMVQLVWFDAGSHQPGRLLILIH